LGNRYVALSDRCLSARHETRVADPNAAIVVEAERVSRGWPARRRRNGYHMLGFSMARRYRYVQASRRRLTSVGYRNACGPTAGAARRQRGKKQMLGRALISAVLWGGLITVALTGPAAAADAATVVTADSSPRSCLRWVWQERSWYDDCWARRPYPVRR
jgi:hypothetical protein